YETPSGGHVLEHAKVAPRGQVGAVDNLHAESQVGGVVAEAAHRLVVGHARQGGGNLEVEDFLGQPFYYAVDHVDHVVVVDEAHLEVDLSELRLAIGTQILVAKAAGDLD